MIKIAFKKNRSTKEMFQFIYTFTHHEIVSVINLSVLIYASMKRCTIVCYELSL